MTKLSTMIESLLTIINRDSDVSICGFIQEESDHSHPYLCAKINCNDCPFDTSNINQLEKHLKTIKTLELIDVDSK